MTETIMTPTIPSILSKICLLEIISAQKNHLQSLVEGPAVALLVSKWRGLGRRNVWPLGADSGPG